MPDDLIPFNPDWTVAPAATFLDWLLENDKSVGEIAAQVAVTTHGAPDQAEITERLEAVLDRKPMDLATAALLHLGTGISLSFWLNYEATYRRDLAIGRTDTSHG
jgi:hypothetical protein